LTCPMYNRYPYALFAESSKEHICGNRGGTSNKRMLVGISMDI
jgi:hypothetical protein